MRLLKSVATGVIAMASLVMALVGATAEAPFCHFVNYTRPARTGGTEWCFRCVAGTQYSATSWTTCPVRQGPEGPGWVQCSEARFGYASTRQDMLCDYTGGTSAMTWGGVIRVTSATLGANCGAPGGNVTAKVGALCNGKDQCTLTGHDVNNPDPAQGCAKTFAVQWQCSDTAGIKSTGVPATANETTPLTLSCRSGGTASAPSASSPGGISLLGVPYAGTTPTTPATSGTGRATANGGGYTGPTTSGTGRATANMGGATLNNGVVPNTGAIIGNQSEDRDRAGRLTREAARVYILNCPSGRNRGNQVYIYQYLKRPGFRAIYPGDWGHAVGGRDHATYYEALGAACPP